MAEVNMQSNIHMYCDLKCLLFAMHVLHTFTFSTHNITKHLRTLLAFVTAVMSEYRSEDCG